MLLIRRRQADDVHRHLKKCGASSIDAICDAVCLPKFSVKSRLQEHPEWFRETPNGEWEVP